MNHKLLFRWNDILESFVFADEGQAIRTDQLHRSLFRAHTWEDLKASVHPDEYWYLVSMYHDFELEMLDTEPSGNINWDFFDNNSYSEGIYPAFLIYTMEEIIPEDILGEFGSDEILTDYGSYRQIKPVKLVPMIGALTSRGYDVVPAGDLIFDDFF